MCSHSFAYDGSTYNTKTKLDMSAIFKPFPLKVNKLYLVLLAFRQECGNVNVYVLSNSPISYKLKFISLLF